MCYYDPDGGFIDDEIEATKFDIRRKQREEEELIRQIESEDKNVGKDDNG